MPCPKRKRSSSDHTIFGCYVGFGECTTWKSLVVGKYIFWRNRQPKASDNLAQSTSFRATSPSVQKGQSGQKHAHGFHVQLGDMHIFTPLCTLWTETRPDGHRRHSKDSRVCQITNCVPPHGFGECIWNHVSCTNPVELIFRQLWHFLTHWWITYFLILPSP